MSYTNPQYLVSSNELEVLIETADPDLRVFDITVHLVPNPPGYRAVSGLEDYNKSHISGAAFINLAKDLSDTTSGFGFTLPAVGYLEAAFRAAGINNESKVVFYSSGHMMWATRAWWLLLTSGHKNVAVLDGGFKKWLAEGKPTSGETQAYKAGNFDASFNQSKWADKNDVLSAVSDADVCTINALSPGVYRGDADMHYGRRGHIENSKNVFYEEVLTDGCFKSASEIETVFTEKGILNKPQIIAYCGGGISATIDTMALSLIGHDGVSVYDGSMSEWVSDESLPLIMGEE
ncbi:MAG: thiosulfate/3-mercaptopyruvate sulfurtransferase [Candidatus Azotimanducaceae bacterium]|jgi:thiosulfate/3-mercaptopyruvate sulfurtransferase